MTSLFLAHRQMVHFLGHEIWVAQCSDGIWRVWIEGKRKLRREAGYPNADEAKKAAHSLAHWRIEGKRFCDCATELLWKRVQWNEGDSLTERRRTKRITYYCEAVVQGEAILRIGRVADLSVGGAFINTLSPPSEGSVLTLSFRIGNLKIETQGRVIHRKPLEGMGVQFLDLSRSFSTAISKLVSKKNRSRDP